MDSTDGKDFIEKLEQIRFSETINIRATGKVRKNMELDAEEVSPEVLYPAYQELETRIVIRNLAQAYELSFRLQEVGSEYGKNIYDNPQTNKAGRRMMRELREGVKARKTSIAETIRELSDEDIGRGESVELVEDFIDEYLYIEEPDAEKLQSITSEVFGQ